MKFLFYKINWWEGVKSSRKEFEMDKLDIKVVDNRSDEEVMEAYFLMENLIVELNEFDKDQDILINTCKAMIEQYKIKIEKYEQEKEDKRIEALSQIKALMEGLPLNETKTQFSLKLPSAKIIIKKEEKVIKLNKDADKNMIPEEFIKIEKVVNWMELKKNLFIIGENIIDETTGEAVNYCSIETKPEKMTIKL